MPFVWIKRVLLNSLTLQQGGFNNNMIVLHEEFSLPKLCLVWLLSLSSTSIFSCPTYMSLSTSTYLMHVSVCISVHVSMCYFMAYSICIISIYCVYICFQQFLHFIFWEHIVSKNAEVIKPNIMVEWPGRRLFQIITWHWLKWSLLKWQVLPEASITNKRTMHITVGFFAKQNLQWVL